MWYTGRYILLLLYCEWVAGKVVETVWKVLTFRVDSVSNYFLSSLNYCSVSYRCRYIVIIGIQQLLWNSDHHRVRQRYKYYSILYYCIVNYVNDSFFNTVTDQYDQLLLTFQLFTNRVLVHWLFKVNRYTYPGSAQYRRYRVFQILRKY